MRSPLPVLVAAVVAVVAGCGKSEEEKMFEELERQCDTLGTSSVTVRDAEQQFGRGADFVFTEDCTPDIASIGGARDQCAPAAEDPQCRVQYIWIPRDPDLREPEGACLRCDIRINQSELEGLETVLDAPVCAARFDRGVRC